MRKIDCLDMNLLSLALQHQADHPGCKPASHLCPLMTCQNRKKFVCALPRQQILMARDQNALVRFSVYNPSRHLYAWCYTPLMKEIAFRNEVLIAQDGNYVRAATRYHLIDTPKRLSERIAANFSLRFTAASLTVDSIQHASNFISVKMASPMCSLAAPSRKVDMHVQPLFYAKLLPHYSSRCA
jgi:hypothetical protein